MAPRAVELKLRLGDIGPSNSGGGIRKRLKREKHRGSSVTLGTPLIRQTRKEPGFVAFA